MAINIFAQGQQAFDHSFDRTQGFYDQATRRKAGAKLATGDRTGAAAEFGNAGMIPEARQMQADQFAVEDRQAGQAQEQKAEKAKRAQLLIGATKALKQLPWDPNSPTPAAARRQALSHPIFEMAGLPREELDKLTDADLSDQSLDMFVGAVERELEIVKSSDGSWVAIDKNAGREVASGMTPQRERYEQVDPTKNLVRIPGTEGGAAAPPMAGGGFDAVIDPLLKREGGYTPRDGRSGAPANFGINQKYNPDVDVKGLNSEQAKQLYKSRYWDAINGDQLPPEAQAAVFDAAVNQGPQRATQWWQQSGGDLQKFNELRLQHYRTRPDYAQNGKSWERRVTETGGPQVVMPGKPKAAGRMATPADKAALGLPADAPYWIDESGKPSAVSGEKPNKPLTEYQGKSVEYMNAALGGNERLNDLATRGIYKPRTATDSLFSREKDGTKRLVLRTDEDRQFMQAAKEWLAPILRKDTGAAVTDSELATYMDIYIPKFEDSPQVMWQKAQARDKKMRALYGANKTAYDGTFGDPGKWKVLTDPRTRPSARPTPAKGKPPIADFFK